MHDKSKKKNTGAWIFRQSCDLNSHEVKSEKLGKILDFIWLGLYGARHFYCIQILSLFLN